MSRTPSILFVCLGNICRSPTAEAVFRQRAQQSGLEVIIDSAGTGGWHAGEPPDPRAIEHGALKGYDLTDQSARKVTHTDFSSFDYVLAMDAQNLSHLRDMCPAGYSGHLSRFLDFAPHTADKNVPDPYYGGEDGFSQVIRLIEAASDGLITHLSLKAATKTT
ncbi:MAG: low molecular weight protein-tyrosine-phosphatase [Maricaulaceae bacterium]